MQAFNIDENERKLNEEKLIEMQKLIEEQKQIEKEEKIKKLNEWRVFKTKFERCLSTLSSILS